MASLRSRLHRLAAAHMAATAHYAHWLITALASRGSPPVQNLQAGSEGMRLVSNLPLGSHLVPLGSGTGFGYLVPFPVPPTAEGTKNQVKNLIPTWFPLGS
jgi:hypothetical protein